MHRLNAVAQLVGEKDVRAEILRTNVLAVRSIRFDAALMIERGIAPVHRRIPRLVFVVAPRMVDLATRREAVYVHEPANARERVEQPTDIARLALGKRIGALINLV